MAQFYATLTYYPNDGSSSWSETEYGESTQGYGYVVFSLPTLTRTGYTFNGWDFNGSIRTGSITLYADSNGESYSVTASWTAAPVTYTITSEVTFDANGGSPSSRQILSGESSTTDGYLSSTTQNAPTRSGYIFDGWKLGSTVRQAGQSYTVYATVSGTSYTWVAQWTPRTYPVEITFDGDGGSPVPSPISTAYTTPAAYVAVNIPNTTPTRQGYVFGGWGAQLMQPGQTYNFTTGNYTLVAQWLGIPVSGKVRIKTANGWVSATPYIKTDSGWKMALGEVFDGTGWITTNG